MDLQGMLTQALSGNAVSQISQQIGADEGTTSNAIQAALPLLVGALARNSATPEGAASVASALDRDHDGSLLDNLGGFLASGNTEPGQGILGHLFGGQKEDVAQGVSQASGLDAGSAMQLLALLAPVVMGVLGRHKQEQGLDLGSLAGMLGGQSQQMAAGSPIVGMLSSLLDQNHDGSAVDDVLRIAGNFFNRR